MANIDLGGYVATNPFDGTFVLTNHKEKTMAICKLCVNCEDPKNPRTAKCKVKYVNPQTGEDAYLMCGGPGRNQSGNCSAYMEIAGSEWKLQVLNRIEALEAVVVETTEIIVTPNLCRIEAIEALAMRLRARLGNHEPT